MSLLTPFVCSARCMIGVQATLCRPQSVLPKQHVIFGLHARFKSERARSRPDLAASARRSTNPDSPIKQAKSNPESSSARKNVPLQNNLDKRSQSPKVDRHFKNARAPNPYPVNQALAPLASKQTSTKNRNVKPYVEAWKPGSKVTHNTPDEPVYRDRVPKKKRPVLWPGIWTLSALAGTYGALAYLDVKAGIPSSDGSHIPVRAQLPQNWVLTPEIFRAGLAAGWNELDNLTIGIAVASVAVFLLFKTRPFTWSRLCYVTGGPRWIIFISPLLYSTWSSLALGTATLAWYLPSVAYYLDGDLFHTTAFLASVSLITSYLARLACRLNLVQGPLALAGPSHLTHTLFGIYCAVYAHEKLWIPTGFVFRLDAWHWGVLFCVSQAWRLARTSNVQVRFRVAIHLISFVMGLAYAQFNVKHHLWIPLVSEVSSTWGVDAA